MGCPHAAAKTAEAAASEATETPHSGTPTLIRARKRDAPVREARSSPPTHRGARVIGTDALRIVLILREPRDGQERKQDSEDDPNINAHQSSPAARSYPADTQR